MKVKEVNRTTKKMKKVSNEESEVIIQKENFKEQTTAGGKEIK